MQEHKPVSPDSFDQMDPDRLDEINDWSPLVDAYTHAEISMTELLRRLVSDPQMPHRSQLVALSDLGSADTELVRSAWPSIPVERRRQILVQLIDQAADNLTLELGRVLRIALDDAAADVRLLAVQGLWEDDDPGLVGRYVQLLQRDPSVAVRAEAATALGAHVLAGELGELDSAPAMRAEEALLAVLHNEHEPIAVRCRALESIAYSGEVGVRQLIEDAYYAAQEELQLSAVSAMARSADVRWRNLAQAELNNPSAAIRAQAAYACGELEAQAALKDLFDLLQEEEDRAVRLACIQALGRIGGREARNALESVAESADVDEAEAATAALEEMAIYGGDGDIPLFDEGLEEFGEIDGDSWYEEEDTR